MTENTLKTDYLKGAMAEVTAFSSTVGSSLQIVHPEHGVVVMLAIMVPNANVPYRPVVDAFGHRFVDLWNAAQMAAEGAAMAPAPAPDVDHGLSDEDVLNIFAEDPEPTEPGSPVDAFNAADASHFKRPAPHEPTAGPLAEKLFTGYFMKNYPGPDTLIHRPEWHAPKIYSMAKRLIERDMREQFYAKLEEQAVAYTDRMNLITNGPFAKTLRASSTPAVDKDGNPITVGGIPVMVNINVPPGYAVVLQKGEDLPEAPAYCEDEGCPHHGELHICDTPLPAEEHPAANDPHSEWENKW